MADDILGHEQLDHGKHLHKHHEKPRRGRDSRLPNHIGLVQNPVIQKPMVEKHHWSKWAIGACVTIPLILLLYNVFRPLAIILAVLLVNTIIEFHKWFTQAAPVDLEVVSLGTAYLAASHGFWWAFILAILGPVVAHAFIGYIGDATAVKVVSLIIVAAAASILGVTPTALFIAVLFGFLFQLFVFAFILGHSLLSNIIMRVTTTAFTAYIIFMLLPAIH